MARTPRAKPVPPLVVEAVEAAYGATKGLPGRWTSVSSQKLDARQEKIDAAILLPTLSGYLSIGGKPAHSVIVTAEGIELLKKRGRL
jgi:hypothetical protein